MTNYFSDYYQQNITTDQLLELSSKYEAYCEQEGLLPIYTENDIKVAIDDKSVAQDLINQLITYKNKCL
jgi:isochorismate hydrolase